MRDRGGPEAAALRERVAAVRARIADAARRAGRRPDEITLVGVSKRQPPERIAAAVRAGLTQLGENYAQEARAKRPLVEELLAGGAAAADEPAEGSPAPRWRMVGPVQRNKARLAVELFDAVDTVDRTSLAEALERRAARAGRVLEVCLQVDLSGEPQKAGADPASLPALLEACAPLAHLRVVGLMTIPAAAADPEAARPVFAQLRALRDRLRAGPAGASLRELSMGMSADFEVAIEEGATHVRVGTALFGPRPEPARAGREEDAT